MLAVVYYVVVMLAPTPNIHSFNSPALLEYMYLLEPAPTLSIQQRVAALRPVARDAARLGNCNLRRGRRGPARMLVDDKGVAHTPRVRHAGAPLGLRHCV